MSGHIEPVSDDNEGIYEVPPPPRSSQQLPDSPPPLLPKKGSSFRISMAMLDKKTPPEQPRPVPRSRNSGLKSTLTEADKEALNKLGLEMKEHVQKVTNISDTKLTNIHKAQNSSLPTSPHRVIATSVKPLNSDHSIPQSPNKSSPNTQRPVPKPRPRKNIPLVPGSKISHSSEDVANATGHEDVAKNDTCASEALGEDYYFNMADFSSNTSMACDESESKEWSPSYNLPPDPDSLEMMLNEEIDKKYGFTSILKEKAVTSDNDEDDNRDMYVPPDIIGEMSLINNSSLNLSGQDMLSLPQPCIAKLSNSYIAMQEKTKGDTSSKSYRNSHAPQEKTNSENNDLQSNYAKRNSGQEPSVDLKTPKPFDILPFKPTVPLSGSSTGNKHSVFDFSDLDPLFEVKSTKVKEEELVSALSIDFTSTEDSWANFDHLDEPCEPPSSNTYTSVEDETDQARYYSQIDQTILAKHSPVISNSRQSSIHFKPPEAPPPPFPREQNRIPIPKAPPVPPRPFNVGLPETVPQNTPESTDVFDVAIAPVFSPKEDMDPFQDTNFDYVCHKFNTNITTPSILPRSPLVNNVGAMSKSDVDPERISKFVIPPPGSFMKDEQDLSKEYTLAGEISSDSEGSEEQMPPWQNIRPEAHIAEPMSSRKNSRDGYLLKQGGHNANRGWRRRWVVFNGASLSYYSDNTSQVSIRIIPIKCMTEVEADIKPTDKDNFRFKLHTTLKNRIFLFASDTRDDCLNWALTLGAAITEYKKLPVREVQPEKPDKEGFVRINSSSKKYYVSITGPTLQYYHSLEDYHIGSPIHQIDMKLASVKVKERKKCKLQLATHYRYFEFTFDDDSEMQNWYMAMEDAIAEGLADDTVLEKVYDNLSNKNCADCGAENPHWASINLGIVVCKNCAGVHRAFDYRVSKIKSLRMDTRVWTPSLIELMVTIGNANANAFWEFTLPPGMKAQPKDSMEKRKEYITKKYIGKKFSNLHELHSMGPQALGKELVSVAGSADVLDLMKILFSGAQVLYRINNCGQTAYEVAKDSGQRLNMELLYQNSGDPQSQLESVSDENRLREDIRLQGYLNKTGPMRGKFESRWCVLEHGSLTYYANEKSTTFKGTIDRKEMCMIQSVESDKIGYHFDLSTTMKENRIFSFSSDCKEDAGEWIRTIAKLMAPIAVMEHVGMIDIKFAGAAHMRESLSQDWQQTFLVFSWRGLNYMNRDLKFDYLDLRKASGIKKQLTGDGYQKQGPYFVISSTVKSVYIQATLPRDTEQMFLALSQAISESGRTLHDQPLTSKSVPVIVDKCIAYITTHGLKEKGIYRQTGQLSRVQTLLDEFRKDAHSVVLTNYTVHEVAGALKKFLRELDDSVFERNNYGNWIEAAGSKDEQHRMGLYKYYLGRMPEVNRQTLKAVILHLLDVAQNEHENSMSITNLATCFAPSLLRTQLDELQFASETASREISIILDILKNRDFFFKVDEKDTIVENNIRDALLKMKKGSIKGSTDNVNTPSCMLTPVLLLGESDHSVNISVTPEKTVQDGLIEALANFRRNNRNLEIRNYILEEQLFDGMLERPLFNEELISKTTVRWLEWSSFYDRGINTRLCLRNTDIMENLKKSALHSFLSNVKLNYKDPSSKKFSKKTVGFRQLKLVLFKSSEAKDESVSWNAEDITVYIGTMLKKNLPSGCKFFLTFIVNGEDISNNKDKERSFGHCFGFETETEMMKWSAAIYSAQHPASF